MELILQAEENIRRIAPEKLVLISTIDVFENPQDVDETTGLRQRIYILMDITGIN